MFKKILQKAVLPSVDVRRKADYYYERFRLAFGQKFSKMMRLNSQALLFFLPTMAILLIAFFVNNALLQNLPFSANLGMGYFYSQRAYQDAAVDKLITDLWVYLALIPLLGLGGLSMAGMCNVFRKFVSTEEDVNLLKDFFGGIKKGYKTFLISYTIMGVLVFLIVLNFNYIKVLGVTWYSILSFVASILLAILGGVFITFFMTQDRELKFVQKLKNSAVFTIGDFPRNALFLLITYAPIFIFLLSSTLFLVGVVIYLFVGFYWSGIVATAYTEFIYNKVAPAKEASQKKRVKQ